MSKEAKNVMGSTGQSGCIATSLKLQTEFFNFFSSGRGQFEGPLSALLPCAFKLNTHLRRYGRDWLR